MSANDDPQATLALKTRAVLKDRARLLALEPETDVASEDRIEVTEFLLNDERYAVESLHVREVSHVRSLTPVPCTPAFVVGLMNLRGEVLPVIDLKRFFGIVGQELTGGAKVIVLRGDAMEFGILVDAVPGVIEVRLDSLQPSLATLTGIRAKYLRGVTEDRLAVLDAAALLADEEIVVHDNA